MVCLDRDWNLIAAEQASESESNVCAENLAYVIYTSGINRTTERRADPARWAAQLSALGCAARRAGSARLSVVPVRAGGD